MARVWLLHSLTEAPTAKKGGQTRIIKKNSSLTPIPLQLLLLQLLEKEADQRPASAVEVRSTLETLAMDSREGRYGVSDSIKELIRRFVRDPR